ncbi:MAG: DnaJ domain-containing protein [Dehalococcoidia bacterium]|nr:DnaJ domain-containing protein [Dehalococcoidia bacterium]
MADAAPLIDYYAVLNLPPRADLAGIENAYARLSDELVKRAEVDETSQDALNKVNEAYSVLSKPEMRHAYDQEFFAREIAESERIQRAELRRKMWMSNALIGALGVIVVTQAAALVWLGRDEAASLFTVLWGLIS